MTIEAIGSGSKKKAMGSVEDHCRKCMVMFQSRPIIVYIILIYCEQIFTPVSLWLSSSSIWHLCAADEHRSQGRLVIGIRKKRLFLRPCSLRGEINKYIRCGAGGATQDINPKNSGEISQKLV